MAQKKGGLGKGLELLFAENALEDSAKTVSLPINELQPNREQPRRQFDDAALAELSASIAQHGVLQPILVRPMTGGTYQIVAGERRWRASRMAGLTEVPVVVREMADREAAELALIENLQREDLNPMEEALGYQTLMQSYELTQEETAKIVNKSREAVAVYDELSRRLLHDFGITPHAVTRELYRQASHTVGDRTMPMDTVLDHLLEQDPAAGALLCSFEAFRVLCHAEARAMVRSGQATHVALLSVTGEGDKHLTRRSQETAMEILGDQIRTGLRRGDAFCKCSASQYVILLPEANFENSCVVCRRVIGAFTRRYPHSPIRIHYMVRPLSTPDR